MMCLTSIVGMKLATWPGYEARVSQSLLIFITLGCTFDNFVNEGALHTQCIT